MVRSILFILLCLCASRLAYPDAPRVAPFFDSQWRFASIDTPFRAGRTRGNQTAALRTAIGARIRASDRFSVNIEIVDARAHFNTAEEPPTTGETNPLDILEANLQWTFRATSGLRGSVRLGRLTKDLGSRRLVARNIFRNTINAFEGIDASLQLPGDQTLTLLALNPVDRRPTRAADRAANRIILDRSDDDRLFLGAHLDQPLPFVGARLETYVFGLFERDDADETTRNRSLVTPGLRVNREPSPGLLDFELETAVNLGTARATTAAGDRENRPVFGVLGHAEIGYTFKNPWAPRLALAVNHASGEDPNSPNQLDGFDGLFGIQRNDYGNTGLFSALRRNNLETLTAKALFDRSDWGLDGRLLWIFARLATPEAPWSGTGLVDPTGASGRTIGQVMDARVRKWLIQDQVRLEVGASILFKGPFAVNAPGAPDAGDAVYTYVQVSTRL